MSNKRFCVVAAIVLLISLVLLLGRKNDEPKLSDELVAYDDSSVSFVDIIKKFDELYKPTLTYESGDFYKWKTAFKRKVNSIRGRTVNRVAVRAVFGEKEDCQTHWRQKVSIRATEISDASGYLLTPKNIQGRQAAIITSPGHCVFGKDTIAGHKKAAEELHEYPNSSYGKYAVEEGYVVFVPDWWGWGDKSGHLPLVGLNRDKCDTIQMAASMYGLTVLNLHMLDADAIVDFLQSLDYVDENRIGIVGNSYGGRTAMWIGAFNDEIRCVVSAGAMNLFTERASKLCSCAIQCFPGLLEYGDVGEIYSLIAPKPLQLQGGTDDPFLNAADMDKIAETVRKAYKASNSSEKLSIEYFEGGHYLNWSLAREFLKEFL